MNRLLRVLPVALAIGAVLSLVLVGVPLAADRANAWLDRGIRVGGG